jgi:ring-1,2-phenylacetyl-CoA epoxidase subunit PaaE
MSTGKLQQLTLTDTREETAAAKTLVFGEVLASDQTFAWRPGQHLTLRFTLDGEELRRSYSISSSPFSGDPLQITVKRVCDGLVSNYINDHLRPGDTVDAMPPFGGFCLDPHGRARRTYYFFCAGSGVTPIFSMLHSVLLAEPHSVVRLLDGNHNADTIIFRGLLERLMTQYRERLTVSHVLSKPSTWSSYRSWGRGIVDAPAVHRFIDEHPPYAQDTQYYVCGPGDMNPTVKHALMDIDVPADRIHMESYGGGVTQTDTRVEGVSATAQVTLDGERHSVAVAKGQTLLQAVREAGLTPAYSCESGVCGACRAKLEEGDVHMRARMALEDQEVSDGVILTCQTVPTAPTIAVEYTS